MTLYCNDVDLLVLEPGLFAQAVFAHFRRLVSAAATLAGTTLTLGAGSYEAAGITPGMVATLSLPDGTGVTHAEIVAVTSPTTATVSVRAPPRTIRRSPRRSAAPWRCRSPVSSPRRRSSATRSARRWVCPAARPGAARHGRGAHRVKRPQLPRHGGLRHAGGAPPHAALKRGRPGADHGQTADLHRRLRRAAPPVGGHVGPRRRWLAGCRRGRGVPAALPRLSVCVRMAISEPRPSGSNRLWLNLTLIGRSLTVAALFWAFTHTLSGGGPARPGFGIPRGGRRLRVFARAFGEEGNPCSISPKPSRTR